ncbi:MAG: carbon-nitrogen hydrolase family protein, partial [Chloroflexi bacterium]|nr:carbon-nitrogen hydrolase family protein [Chloroflexota bacterium]
MNKQAFLAAAAQVAPAYLDLDRSLGIAEAWISRAGQQGVKLLVFPETWLPGYPFWLDDAPSMALWDYPPTKAVFRRLFENSVEIPSSATERLAHAAQAAQVNVVMGLNERDGQTLYNSMLYISDQGELLGKHRKLVPTFTERMVWGRGDGSTLTVVDTSVGRVGGLVCWEHWMPLARQSMHQQRELVHAAVWPTVKEMLLLASRAYAFEGRTYVIAVGTPLRRDNLPTDLDLLNELEGDGPWMRGGSAIIGPDGECLAGPAGDGEDLLIAEIDPGRVTEELMALDVTGHYARPDVFTLTVDTKPHSCL